MCGCVFVVCLSWEAVRAECGTRQRDRTCEGGKEKDTEGGRCREGRRNDAGGRGTVIRGEETVL